VSRIDVTVPAYGMTNNDSYLKEWLVEEGTAVQEGTEVAPGTVLTWIESIPS